MKLILNHDNVWAFQNKFKLTSKDLKLLLEAYRRITYLNLRDNKTVTYPFAGLGMPSEYKSKFFSVCGIETPRVKNWYRLTLEGQKIVTEMMKVFYVPSTYEGKQKANEFLFTY